MIALKTAAALVCAALLASAAPAKSERVQFDAKDVIVPNAGMAYIYYRTASKQFATFLRSVTSEELAEWTKKHDEALAKAKDKYQHRMKNWNELVAAEALDPGPKPIEPTNENFSFPAPELDHFVMVDSGRVIIDENSHYAYLISVKPGEYTYYGSEFGGSRGALGVCLCMGSVRFTAAANQIVDLGEIDIVPVSQGGTSSKDPTALAAHWMIDPRPQWNLLAPNLPKLPVVAADFHAAGKTANFLGVMVDRLLPMAGVLTYDRDSVIDLRAPTIAPSTR